MMAAIKKLYRAVALMALLNLLAVGGLFAYLIGGGKLTRERTEQIMSVLRGEQEEAPQPEAEEPEPVARSVRSADSMDREQTEDEIMRLRAERRRAELRQQAAAVAAARLQVTREREALERQQAEWTASRKERETKEQSQGFKKELDILSSLKPKVALGFLLAKSKDDAASMLLTMETRKAKKIIESAKTPAQRNSISELLETMREISPDEARALSQYVQ